MHSLTSGYVQGGPSPPLSYTDSDDGAPTPCSTLVNDGASPDAFPGGCQDPYPSTPYSSTSYSSTSYSSTPYSSTPSPPQPPAPAPYAKPSPIDVLRAASMRGDLADLPQRISNALSSILDPARVPPSGHGYPAPDARILQQLVACLSALGVDFSAARAALLNGTGTGIRSTTSSPNSSSDNHNNAEARCTRCAQPFHHAENHPTACQGFFPQRAALPGQPGQSVQWQYSGGHTTSPCLGWERARVDEDLHPNLGFEGVMWSTAQSQPQAQAHPRPQLHPQPQPQPGSSTVSPGPAAGTNVYSPTSMARVPTYMYGDGDGASRVPPTPYTLRFNAPPPSYQYACASPPAAPAPAPGVGATDPSADFVARQRRLGAVPAPRIVHTLPWTESSLYHPPGWITVPSALRRRPGDPWQV